MTAGLRSAHAGVAASGYLHPDYARSVSEFGVPRALSRCGGWVVERSIGGSDQRDAMGCYPLFACSDWRRLGRDLDDLRAALVSLVLVADPFGEYTAGELDAAFDVVRTFKEHFVVELSEVAVNRLARSHRRNLAAAGGGIMTSAGFRVACSTIPSSVTRNVDSLGQPRPQLHDWNGDELPSRLHWTAAR